MQNDSQTQDHLLLLPPPSTIHTLTLPPRSLERGGSDAAAASRLNRTIHQPLWQASLTSVMLPSCLKLARVALVISLLALES